MKYSQIRAFEKHLESSAPNHFSNLYLIVAQDSFERKMASDLLLRFLLKNENHPEYCVKILDAEILTLQTLSDEISSFHLFSKKNVVFIQQAEKLKTQAKEYLEKTFSHLGKTVLIISCATINQLTNFYKKIEKIGIVLNLPKEIKPWEKEKLCTEWIQQQVAQTEKDIDRQAIDDLLKQVGTDYAHLKQEIDKLTCYIGDRRQITSQDIEAICTYVNHNTIWQLGEAILQRRPEAAISISKALLKNDISFFVLLRSLRSQIQTELQVATILENGGGEQDVSLRFPFIKGAIFQKHLKTIQSYGKTALAKSLITIDAAEVQAKNSNIQEEILLERLILQLVSGMGTGMRTGA